MPILDKEIDKYPEGLFELAESDSEASWHLLYTRSRREKDLMRRLAAMDIPFYGPCAKKKSRSPAGRVRTSWVPLFSNYVFLLGNGEAVAEAHRTNCLSNVTAITDKAGLTESLRRLEQLISSEAPVHVEQRLAPGELVRVKAGPFKGCEGVVEKRRGGSHLVVNVDFVQQSVSVELDDFMVEKL